MHSGGRFDCGHHDSGRDGKSRLGLLAKRGRDRRVVQGLRPEILSVVAKIKGGNRDTSPAPGVMLLENLTPAGRRRRDALS